VRPDRAQSCSVASLIAARSIAKIVSKDKTCGRVLRVCAPESASNRVDRSVELGGRQARALLVTLQTEGTGAVEASRIIALTEPTSPMLCDLNAVLHAGRGVATGPSAARASLVEGRRATAL
jgi:hypothetical protein